MGAGAGAQVHVHGGGAVNSCRLGEPGRRGPASYQGGRDRALRQSSTASPADPFPQETPNRADPGSGGNVNIRRGEVIMQRTDDTPGSRGENTAAGRPGRATGRRGLGGTLRRTRPARRPVNSRRRQASRGHRDTRAGSGPGIQAPRGAPSGHREHQAATRRDRPHPRQWRKLTNGVQGAGKSSQFT